MPKNSSTSGGTSPNVQQPSKASPISGARAALIDYVNGDVFKQRAYAMFDGNQAMADRFIRQAQNRMRDTTVTYDSSNGAKSYYDPKTKNININSNFFNENGLKSIYLSEADPTIAHEFAHSFYPYNASTDKNLYYGFFNPTMQSKLRNVDASPTNQRKVYQSINGWDSPKIGYDHDEQLQEAASKVYEAREDMRQQGIWDYTTGEDITPEQWKQYKSKNPHSRLGNYNTDDNAVYLLNNLASNNSKNNYALEDGRYISKLGGCTRKRLGGRCC